MLSESNLKNAQKKAINSLFLMYVYSNLWAHCGVKSNCHRFGLNRMYYIIQATKKDKNSIVRVLLYFSVN